VLWDKNALDVAVDRLSEGAESLVDLYMEAIKGVGAEAHRRKVKRPK